MFRDFVDKVTKNTIQGTPLYNADHQTEIGSDFFRRNSNCAFPSIHQFYTDNQQKRRVIPVLHLETDRKTPVSALLFYRTTARIGTAPCFHSSSSGAPHNLSAARVAGPQVHCCFLVLLQLRAQASAAEPRARRTIPILQHTRAHTLELAGRKRVSRRAVAAARPPQLIEDRMLRGEEARPAAGCTPR